MTTLQYYRFQDPWLLVGLLAIPALIWVYCQKREAVFLFSSIEIIKNLKKQRTRFQQTLPLVLRCLAVFLLVLALARPQEGRHTREFLSRGVDIMLAIDTSGSMRALDFIRNEKRITRLDIVKEVVMEFVGNRQNDRLGIVAFGAEAFTQCPLTLDHNVLLSFLNKMEIGMAGDSTAIGSAIGISVKRLKDLQAETKVIILLTDGRNTAGLVSPQQAAKIAKTYGIKVYTIGVGTHGQAPFLVDTLLGQRYVYQQVDIDEVTLKEIAEQTNAQYFRATDIQSLKSIYAQIDQMETSEVKVKEHTEYTELFHFFIIPGLMILLLEITASKTRWQRIP